MLEYTNIYKVPLAIAVFLGYDNYDYDDRDNVISVTSLLQPLQAIVLAKQNKDLIKQVDFMDLVPSRMGSAIHDSCEKAWLDKDNVDRVLKAFHVSDEMRSRIVVNPTEVKENQIPVYVEFRSEKPVLSEIISGKFDLSMDGTVNDYKSTSVWTYIFDSNADAYIKQGSLYRWLNPDKITSDYININYIFTDWSASKAKQDPTYPQHRTLTKSYPLMSIEETSEWVTDRISKILKLIQVPEDSLPKCTEDELWSSETVYKYYKNPNKTDRATKNFDNISDAQARLAQDGNVGIVKTVPGEVRRCRYCKVVGICKQAEQLQQEGRLIL